MRAEILRLVDQIHREKDIEQEAVFIGLEAAISSALLKKWGEETAVQVFIDRKSGEVTATVGDKALGHEQLREQLGRLAAQTGKQVLFQKIREASREVVYLEYAKKLGTIATGSVMRYEGSAIVVGLGKVEGYLPRSEQVSSERFRINDRLKAYILDVQKNGNQVKIILSRRDPRFVNALFEIEVPEIRDKTIEVLDIAREPGHRTKIAVSSTDANVDCVGACVGVRGSRVKSIREELFGEKIEIVPWNEVPELFIVNALKPAEIVSIDLDYDTRRARVYVTPDQQSITIGKRGQNVRLASALSHWDLDVVTVSEDDIRRLKTEDVDEGDEIGTLVGTARGGADADTALKERAPGEAAGKAIEYIEIEPAPEESAPEESAPEESAPEESAP
ncbi:MAG TPA: transcription termination factor NusA, partial [Planctomycetota bacterium]|nr:transcription termination factor NusA [Planctomycetota bacterium]HOE29643.1 transcription termination factor NusA [Planctomycetota bacterium]HOE87374.1 transcription termination factor NusA [Planctomycetota bacterium]HOR68008.1 transcription termination factor NusA [Planctomycetota bacterium]HPL61015.1 transcription termination factor NusA [Planctomycetota bacterium]